MTARARARASVGRIARFYFVYLLSFFFLLPFFHVPSSRRGGLPVTRHCSITMCARIKRFDRDGLSKRLANTVCGPGEKRPPNRPWCANDECYNSRAEGSTPRIRFVTTTAAAAVRAGRDEKPEIPKEDFFVPFASHTQSRTP